MESGVDQEFFEIWKSFEISSVHCVYLCLYLLNACARSEARDVRRIVVVTRLVGFFFVCEGVRQPQPDLRVDKHEITSHDTHDGLRPAIDAEVLSHDILV